MIGFSQQNDSLFRKIPLVPKKAEEAITKWLSVNKVTLQDVECAVVPIGLLINLLERIEKYQDEDRNQMWQDMGR